MLKLTLIEIWIWVRIFLAISLVVVAAGVLIGFFSGIFVRMVEFYPAFRYTLF